MRLFSARLDGRSTDRRACSDAAEGYKGYATSPLIRPSQIAVRVGHGPAGRRKADAREQQNKSADGTLARMGCCRTVKRTTGVYRLTLRASPLSVDRNNRQIALLRENT